MTLFISSLFFILYFLSEFTIRPHSIEAAVVPNNQTIILQQIYLNLQQSTLPSLSSSSSTTQSSTKIHQRNSRNSGNSNDESFNRKNNSHFIGSATVDHRNHLNSLSPNDVDASGETFYANYAFEDNQMVDDDVSQSDEHTKNINANQKTFPKDQPYPYKKRQQSSSYKLIYTNEIQLKQGRIKGFIRQFNVQSGLKSVQQFLGIPYAEAPVGSRRFMPAGAPLPWTSLKIATHLPPVCPQNIPDLNLPDRKFSKGRHEQIKRLLPYLQNENEDCLYLNIYVPQTEQLKKFPVIVYIHGESYEWNSGNPYDGSVLASYGQVIVITVNFRLGILGFMKPGISEHTVSNFGLLDQIAALQWIKENIDSFNGDANRVTLMGHGTGGSFINFLMVSPVAVGLFHRAILMSGSAMSDWATSNQSLTLTMQIAHGLNCPLIDENEELLNCLRRKRYQEFFKIPISFPPFTTSLGPIVDGHVIPNQPYKVMSQYTDLFSRYDLLFGVTEIESYHIIDAIALQDGLRENERDQLLRLYMRSRYEIRPDLALAATLKKYTDVYNNPVKASSHEHRDVVLDILSDARIVGPLIQTGLFHADVNPRSYMYVFGHNSIAGPYASFERSIIGEELAFVFGAPLAPSGPFPQHYSAQEKLLSEAVMSYWTNFAKTGNPKAPWRDKFLNLHPLEWDNYDVDWPEFNKRNQCYVNIGIPPSIEYKYRQIYMNFWNKELPDELNQIASLQPRTTTITTAPTTSTSTQQKQIHYFPSSFNNKLPDKSVTSVDQHNDIVTGQLRKYATNDNDDSIGNGYGDTKYGSSSYSKENPFHELRLLINKEEQMEKFYSGGIGGGGSIDSDNNYGSGSQTKSLDEGKNAFDNMLNAQPTFGITHTEVQQGTATINKNQQDDNEIVKSESTLHFLIGLIVIFLILNILIYSTFLFRQKKKSSATTTNLMSTKFGGAGGGGILSYDGTNDDDLKRTKNNRIDGDDSFVLDRIKKSNSYDFIIGKRENQQSALNAFQMNRHISSSTLDTHTKVSDWMSQDIRNNFILKMNRNNSFPRRIFTNDNENNKSKPNSRSSTSSFSFGKKFLKKPIEKISIAIDATPQARSNSILQQEPIEITKLKSIENNSNKNIIICQEINIQNEQFENSYIGNSQNAELEILHNFSRSDPVDTVYYTIHKQNLDPHEQITSFIDDGSDITDINVTSLDDNITAKIPLSPEEQLETIQRRNFPKVLPSHYSESYKRQSLPVNSFNTNNNIYFACRTPPIPPPRTISTLGRNFSGRRLSNTITTSPLMLANDCPEEMEPQLTENTLIVGPLVPKNAENLYSKLKQTTNSSIEVHPDNSSDEKKNKDFCDKNNRPSGIKSPSTSFFSSNKSIEIIGPTNSNHSINGMKSAPTGIIKFTSTKPKSPVAIGKINTLQKNSTSRIPRPDFKSYPLNEKKCEKNDNQNACDKNNLDSPSPSESSSSSSSSSSTVETPERSLSTESSESSSSSPETVVITQKNNSYKNNC